MDNTSFTSRRYRVQNIHVLKQGLFHLRPEANQYGGNKKGCVAILTQPFYSQTPQMLIEHMSELIENLLLDRFLRLEIRRILQAVHDILL